jgi:hypothetical protein
MKYYKKIRNIFFAIFLLTLDLSVFSQINSFSYIKSIPGEFNIISSDELGNLYTVKGNQINKYDINGKFLSNYSNYYAGDITFLDTNDPFKILLFYKEFSQIEILDNTLSPVNKIDLSELGFDLISLVCASYQDGFIMFNPPFSELIRISQFLEITNRTGNLFKATGIEVNPNFMLEKDNILYLNNPEYGIMVFDKYGTFNRTIAVKNLAGFQVFDRKLIVNTPTEIIIIDPKTLEENIIELPEEEVLQARLSLSMQEKRLFILREESVKIYSMD